MNTKMTFVLVVSWIFSTILLYKIWRTDDPLWVKCFFTLLAYVPILGPVFMLAILDTPKVNSFDMQDRISRNSHLDSLGSANFEERWRHRLNELKSKIDHLRKDDDQDK